MRYILHENLVFPRFPGVQSTIDPSPDLTGLSDVSGALEVHRLEENEALRIPAVLPDSCEFRVQRLDEAASDSPAQRVIPPLRRDHQVSPVGLSRLVILDPPTEVRSIVGVHPVPVYLPDPPVLPRGHVSQQIPCGPPPVLRIICLPPRRCCLCDRIFLR